LHIYDAAAAPFLIERASLIDGNEGDIGDDMMVDDSENLMLKLKFLPYKVQSRSPMSQYGSCKVLYTDNQRPREFERLVLCADT